MSSGNEGSGRVGNGVFEAVQDIVGYVNLCYIKSDDEELFADIFNAMGKVHYRIWNRFMDEFSDVYCVLRFGDDLGSRAHFTVRRRYTHTYPAPVSSYNGQGSFKG